MSEERAQRINGRFVEGNTVQSAGDSVSKLRAKLFEVVTEDRFGAAWEANMVKAEQGDLAAIREMNMRVLGKPVESDMIERMEAIEKKLADHDG